MQRRAGQKAHQWSSWGVAVDFREEDFFRELEVVTCDQPYFASGSASAPHPAGRERPVRPFGPEEIPRPTVVRR